MHIQKMPSKISNQRRSGNRNSNQEITSAPIDTLIKQVSYAEFRATFQVLAQSMITQDNQHAIALINPYANMATIQVQDFTQIKPLEF